MRTRLGDYIITFSDAKNILKLISLRHFFGFVLAVSIVLFLYLTSNLTIGSILFFLYFVVVMYWDVASKISYLLAVLCLINIVIFSTLYYFRVFNYGYAVSDTISIWVYYFIFMGLSKEIWDSYKHA